jgi:hypothetical protein
MPSRFDRAVSVTRRSAVLAVVPALATLLSLSNVAQALAARSAGGVAFPFPTGLPTLWTYVSLPSGVGTGAFGGPLSITTFVPAFVVGLLVTSALEAGFLGSLEGRLAGGSSAFGESVRRFGLRMVGVNLVRFGAVLVAVPLFVVPPLALAAVLVLTYLLYGLSFVIVVEDVGLGAGLSTCVGHALAGGSYASFGLAHLLLGAVASLVMSALVLNTGLLGILLGTGIAAVPAVFVASYGLLVFRELASGATGGYTGRRKP